MQLPNPSLARKEEYVSSRNEEYVSWLRFDIYENSDGVRPDGEVSKSWKLSGSWALYASSIKGTGDLVCTTHFCNDDDVVIV